MPSFSAISVPNVSSTYDFATLFSVILILRQISSTVDIISRNRFVENGIPVMFIGKQEEQCTTLSRHVSFPSCVKAMRRVSGITQPPAYPFIVSHQYLTEASPSMDYPQCPTISS